MTVAIVSGLLRAYRETHRVFEPSPCYYALTEKFIGRRPGVERSLCR